MNKNMSVLVLTTSFPLNSAVAIGIHVIEKCRHLVKNGIKVKVIAPHHVGSKRKEIIDGIIVNRFRYFFPTKWQQLAYGDGIPTNLTNSWIAKFQLPFFMLAFLFSTIKETKHFDIVHCHWSIAGLIGVIIGRLFKKKVVLMVHGAEVFVLGENPVLKFVLKNVDFFISNSTFTQKKTLAVYPQKNHIVISPGVDIKRFYPQNKIPGLRKMLDIFEDEIFVLAIGKFIPRKGFEYLLEAFHIVVNQKKIKNIKLRIGGRGPLKPKYEKLIDKYSLNSFVTFLGYIKDKDIPSYYSEADIFVLPSIVDDKGDTEGLGVVSLEANACKTPVIGSKVGGILDVITDGMNGYFVEQKNSQQLAEKIIKLADSRELRTMMGEKGRHIVEQNFNWDNISKRIIEVYEFMQRT
jgi:glycosyltransferase involved in cell wall biosynthesis